jgi:transketolase
LRPADANETAAAWRVALERRGGPTALVLTRQKVPVLPGTREAALDGAARGAYVLRDTAAGAEPVLVLLASGSEVALALDAQERLEGEGIACRVVSFPSWELFAAQSAAYRNDVLPPGVPLRLAVEAATPFGWERWVGDGGAIHGIERFGASAPLRELAREYGFTTEDVVERARRLLAASGSGSG